MARIKIVFFVPEWPALKSGVLHSQVLSVAKYLQENDIDCMFIGCDNFEVTGVDPRAIIKENYGIDAVIFDTRLKNKGFVSNSMGVYSAYRKAKKILKRYKPTHIYTRSPFSSLLARKLARKNDLTSVFDARAALAEEIAFRRKRKGIRYHIMSVVEFNEYRKSDRVACVSRNLKEYIQMKTGRTDVVVIPSCFDKTKFYYDEKSRQEIRAYYNLNATDKMLCYSGSLHQWQRIDDIIALFANISKREKGYRFLILTEEVDELRALIKENNLSSEKLIVKYASHGKVYQYLSAADAGIIMREDSIVNNVASPIKVGEYLGCGLPVVLTKGIGDFSETIPGRNIGLLLDEKKDMADQVITFLHTHTGERLREEAIRFSQDYLSTESHLEEYKRLYS